MRWLDKVKSTGSPTHLAIITVSYVGLSLIIYQLLGVKVVNDSARYLEYAENLNHGFYIERHNIWYFSYVLFLFVLKSFGVSLGGIVFVQFLFGLFGAWCIYFGGKQAFANGLTGLIATLLFIFFFDAIQWHCYILCESFYSSMLAVTFMAIVKWYKSKSPVLLIITIVLMIVTFFAKPTGIALLVACCCYAIFKLVKLTGRPVYRIAIVSGIVMTVLLLVNRMLATYTILENDYRLGEIIYAVSELPNHPDMKWLKIQPPNPLAFTSAELPPIVRVAAFVFSYPIYWLQLFSSKVAYLILHVRPFWSVKHNLLSLVILLPSYFFVVKVLVKKWIPRPAILVASTYLLTHIVIVGITSVDWDGRFIIPMLPVVFLLAAHGFVISIRQKENSR